MKLVLLLFVALVVGVLSLSSYKSMTARQGVPTQGAPAAGVRQPAGGVPLEAFAPEAAEAATKARMDREQ